MKINLKMKCFAWLTILLVMANTVTVSAAEPYLHDPMENPKAAADIVVNPDAVYGYSPSPTSDRLKEYVDYDWTDEAVVNEMREQREEYHNSIRELYDMIDSMRAEDRSMEEIARAVSTRRNELRLEAYKDDPEGLEKVKMSNLENYGDENGGSPDFFFEKYGSWETVLEKALSVNAGADACLGLYDAYYDTYLIEAPEDTENAKKTATSGDGEYTVTAGDCLWKIAEKMLGDGNLWEKIFDLNQDIIHNPRIIFPGQVLKIEK